MIIKWFEPAGHRRDLEAYLPLEVLTKMYHDAMTIGKQINGYYIIDVEVVTGGRSGVMVTAERSDEGVS